MADVRPISALRYDPDVVGEIGRVVAPPYDVIDAAERQRLLELSPHNVVEVDLPEDPAGGDRYAHAARILDRWIQQGVLTADTEPTLLALTQRYTAPDGDTHTRHGIFARVRVEDYGAGRIRPHERTQPGPKQDRLDLTRATRLNLSPIFSLTTRDAWAHVAPGLVNSPWAEFTDPDGTLNRVWRITDPAVHTAVAETLADAELLIADGHHRYETARTYAEEIGGEGPHRYTLMSLTALRDPGLTVFPTHRLIKGLDDGSLLELGRGLREHFECSEVPENQLDPAGESGLGTFGYTDSRGGRFYRLKLKDRTALDRALADRSEAYRELDAVVLETVVLKGLLGMSEEDIAAKRGIGYAKSLADVPHQLHGGGYQAAFVLRPTPVEQVRTVADSGEIMPPKSTYFFPKIPTGLIFNPLDR